MRNRTTQGLLLLLLSFCHTNLSRDGKEVKTGPQPQGQCESIGHIEVTCCPVGYYRDEAETLNLLKNRAAEQGANRITDIQITKKPMNTGAGETRIFRGSAQAWACSFMAPDSPAPHHATPRS